LGYLINLNELITLTEKDILLNNQIAQDPDERQVMHLVGNSMVPWSTIGLPASY
jgi:hypothetical protein